MRLKGKIALVTGAAGGIGSVTAKRFAEEGATLILSDINKEGCEKVHKEIEKNGKKGGTVIMTDVTKEDEIVAMFSQVKKEYGRLDILANIAGGDFEFSYPCMVYGSDNRIHLVYTNNRTTIRYARFTPEWLKRS